MWDLNPKIFNLGHSCTLFYFESGFRIETDQIFLSHFKKKSWDQGAITAVRKYDGNQGKIFWLRLSRTR